MGKVEAVLRACAEKTGTHPDEWEFTAKVGVREGVHALASLVGTAKHVFADGDTLDACADAMLKYVPEWMPPGRETACEVVGKGRLAAGTGAPRAEDLRVVAAVLRSVEEADGVVGAPTGVPSCGGKRVTSLAGVTPSAVTWTEDRGNWMWDGALVALRAAGVDVDSPLPAAAEPGPCVKALPCAPGSPECVNCKARVAAAIRKGTWL